MAKTEKSFQWTSAKQLSITWILLAFLLPALYATILFRVLLPLGVENGWSPVVAWSLFACFGLATLVAIGIYLLKKEAKEHKVSFWQRAGFINLSKKQWWQVAGIIILGLIVALLAKPLTISFMELFNLTVPSYMPFWLDPNIDIANTPTAELTPGFNIVGQYWLIGLIFVTLLLNILAEELYFRAYLLPKMISLKTWAWIVNGTLFAAYHIFQIWLFPTLLIASLFFAYIFYKYRSIWPLLIAHFVGNVLFSTIAIASLIIS